MLNKSFVALYKQIYFLLFISHHCISLLTTAAFVHHFFPRMSCFQHFSLPLLLSLSFISLSILFSHSPLTFTLTFLFCSLRLPSLLSSQFSPVSLPFDMTQCSCFCISSKDYKKTQNKRGMSRCIEVPTL